MIASIADLEDSHHLSLRKINLSAGGIEGKNAAPSPQMKGLKDRILNSERFKYVVLKFWDVADLELQEEGEGEGHYGGNKYVMSPAYQIMICKLQRLMVKPPIDDEILRKSSEDDWKRDCMRGGEGDGVKLRFTQFLLAWFELAVFWVEIIEEEPMCEFVEMCYDGISCWETVKEEGESEADGDATNNGSKYDNENVTGEAEYRLSPTNTMIRVWKSDADICYNELFFSANRLGYKDNFFDGHEEGSGSLEDTASLFAGRFNFRKTSPWSKEKSESTIIAIYSMFTVQRRTKKVKKNMLLKMGSNMTISDGKKAAWAHSGSEFGFQAVVLAYFFQKFGDQRDKMLQQLKQFIMSCFLYASSSSANRVTLFKYFFTERHDSARKDSYECAGSFVDLLGSMFPEEKNLEGYFSRECSLRGFVPFTKTYFLKLLRHNIPHVPSNAASMVAFHLNLGSMLYYRDVSTGLMHATLSSEGRKIFTKNEKTKKRAEKVYGSVSKKMNRSNRSDMNTLAEYIDCEQIFTLCTKLWELEQEYRMVAIAENCVHFIQHWCRKHQKRKKTRLDNLNKVERNRKAALQRAESERKRLTLITHQREENSRKNHQTFLLENSDAERKGGAEEEEFETEREMERDRNAISAKASSNVSNRKSPKSNKAAVNTGERMALGVKRASTFRRSPSPGGRSPSPSPSPGLSPGGFSSLGNSPPQAGVRKSWGANNPNVPARPSPEPHQNARPQSVANNKSSENDINNDVEFNVKVMGLVAVGMNRLISLPKGRDDGAGKDTTGVNPVQYAIRERDTKLSVGSQKMKKTREESDESKTGGDFVSGNNSSVSGRAMTNPAQQQQMTTPSPSPPSHPNPNPNDHEEHRFVRGYNNYVNDNIDKSADIHNMNGGTVRPMTTSSYGINHAGLGDEFGVGAGAGGGDRRLWSATNKSPRSRAGVGGMYGKLSRGGGLSTHNTEGISLGVEGNVGVGGIVVGTSSSYADNWKRQTVIDDPFGGLGQPKYARRGAGDSFQDQLIPGRPNNSSKEKRTGKSKYSTSANGQGNGHSNTNGYINGNTANFRHNRRTSPRAKHTKTKTKSQQKNKTWVKPGQGFSDAGIGIKDINAARGMYNDVNIAGYY